MFKSYREIPSEERNNSGVYLIIFPNEKKYLGRSCHLKRRIVEHIISLYKKDSLWYEDCIKENPCLAAKTLVEQFQLFWKYCEVYLFLTNEDKYYETLYLNRICSNKRTKEFYNKQYNRKGGNLK